MNIQLAKQYFERAEALRDAGKPEEALALFNQLDEAFPNTKNIGVARARTYAAMGRVSEAVHLCDALIEAHDSRRARELRVQLLKGALDATEAVHRGGTSPPRFSKRTLLTGGIAAGLVVAIAWFASRADRERNDAVRDGATPRSSAVSSNPVQNVSGGLDEGNVARALANANANSPPKPGTVHLPQTWALDHLGVPKWKSGIFYRVPCLVEHERTINVYLPLAYDAKPEALFPGVLISDPGGNPDFLGLESWAEKQEVILVALNSSRNGPSSNNIAAQDAAFATIQQGMRVDPRMGFAIGMSGAAMASWLAAWRNPEVFQGVVMMGQGGFEDRMLAPHVRVAYIRGVDEPNNWYIPRVIQKLRANGNPVRDQLVPGAHVMGPVSVRIEMLDWMLSSARQDFGLPSPSG